jgi:hypothetical protein
VLRYSLAYPRKNFGACAEAGAVTTNDPEVTENVRMPRHPGQPKKSYHDISRLERPPGCSSRRQPSGAPGCLLISLGPQKPYKIPNIGQGSSQLQERGRGRLFHCRCSLRNNNQAPLFKPPGLPFCATIEALETRVCSMIAKGCDEYQLCEDIYGPGRISCERQ